MEEVWYEPLQVDRISVGENVGSRVIQGRGKCTKTLKFERTVKPCGMGCDSDGMDKDFFLFEDSRWDHTVDGFECYTGAKHCFITKICKIDK